MYTSDEIDASVSKIVLSSIRAPYDVLGIRRTDITFDDIQQAAAGVFLLYFNAPFYVALLSSQRLLELVRIEAVLLTQLEVALESTGRLVSPIRDLTALNNAKAALFELEGAVAGRGQTFKDISKVPAFQRFVGNTDLFLGQVGPAVKQGGDIVPTPEEARQSIPSLLSQLVQSHTELVRRAGLLANAIGDFNGMNLPSLVASGVIQRARQVLDQQAAALDKLSEQARLGIIRGVVLDLLSSKGLVQKYGSLGAVGPFYSLTGTGQPFSDSAHFADAASLEATIPGYYNVYLATKELDLWLDAPVAVKFTGAITSLTKPVGTNLVAQFNSAGLFAGVLAGDVVYVKTGPNAGRRYKLSSANVNTLVGAGLLDPTTPDVAPQIEVWPAPTLPLSIDASFLASLDGQISEPFDISGGVNDQLSVSLVTGAAVSTFTPTLPTGGAVTADAVVAALNAAFGVANLVAESYFAPLKFSGALDVTSLGGNNIRFSLPFGSFPSGLNIVGGDIVQVLAGPNLAPWTITAVTSTHLDAAGTFPATPETGRDVTVGPPEKRVRIKAGPNSNFALTLRQAIRLNADTQVHKDTAIVLGFAPGISSASRPSSPKEVATSLNNQTQQANFSTSFLPVDPGLVKVRTEPSNLSLVIFFRLQTDGTVTPGLSVTFTVPAGVLAAGVQAGDNVILRASVANPPDAGLIGAITARTDTTISATFTSSLTAGSVSIEVGPDLSGLQTNLIRVLSGPNAGDYNVLLLDDSFFQFTIESALPVSSSRGQFVLLDAQVGKEFLVLDSADLTTSSRVSAKGPAASLLFLAGSGASTGTTRWFELPELPKGLSRGDVFELYLTQYNQATTSLDIISVNGLVLELDGEVSSVLAPISFAGDAQVPFARLRVGHTVDFTAFSDALHAWLAQPPQAPGFFVDLNRLVNPLLVNANPTGAQVEAALAKLDALGHLLIEAGSPTLEQTIEHALLGYTVEPVPAVDTLFKSFRDKGADRAADLLLEAQFSTFFGLDVHGSSYASQFLSSLRDMARLDLPMRKSDRQDTQDPRLLASGESPDFEFDQDDIDPTPTPDPPAGF